MSVNTALNVIVTRSSQNALVVLQPFTQTNQAVDVVCRTYDHNDQVVYLTPTGTAT